MLSLQKSVEPENPRLEWLENIHNSVRKDEIKPKQRAVDSFFEWILDRDDIQDKINAWLTYLRRTNNQAVKKNEKAEKFKEQGNSSFKMKNYPASVESYTQSARYAQFDTDNFSMAIANRSAAFFHMCRYKESLKDIELAIECGYPEKLTWKLHLRAAQCHLKLRQGKLAEESLASLKKTLEKSNEITGAMRDTIFKQAKKLSSVAVESQKRYETFAAPSKDKTEPSIEKLLPKNLTFPFASSAVIRKHSPTRGRHVVARKPIKRGDILFVEKPFAWVPFTHGNNVTLCAHCSGSLDDALLPCRGCLEALYCSATCWKDAWLYHQWECPGYHVGLWQQTGVSHLAFKILSVAVTTTDRIWFNDVQRLATNVEERSIDDIFGIAILSLMVTTYVEQFTNFFDIIDLKSSLVDKFTDASLSFDFDLATKKGKKLYVGSIILRHSLQMLANAHAVWRQIEDASSEREVTVKNGVRIAIGAYPSASTMNHSCDPTALNTFWKNWLIIKAVKNIPEGEEIFLSYGPYFKEMPKAQRQKYLKGKYCFDCKCSACMNPLFDNFSDRFDGLKCLKCSGSAFRLPGGETQRCFDCGATSKVTCTGALQKASELCDKGMNLTDIDKWEEAIPYFEKSLAIREKHMYKHNEDVAIALDALANTYGTMRKWLKSIWYFEKSLAAFEERYGAESLIFANELNKITEVGVQYLRRTTNRRTTEYRETFIKIQKYVDRALEIFDIIGEPFKGKHEKMNNRKEHLCAILEQLRI